MIWAKMLPMLIIIILALFIGKGDFRLQQLISKTIKEIKLDKAVKEMTHKITPKGASDIIVVRNTSNGQICATPIKVHFGPLPLDELEEWPVRMILNGKWLELWVGRNGILTEEFNVEELKYFSIKRETNLVQFALEIDGKQFSQTALLYLWDSNAKIVVTDIDGTITKSDAIGMILEEDWLQKGVLSLFGRIQHAGYKFVYLSARPAAMGSKTRAFISRSELPPGPIILSAQPLWSALKTALNNPDQIKIKNLQNLKEKFNSKKRHSVNPFVAGFGNQITDLVAYRALHFPRVFLINEKGKVHIFDHFNDHDDDEMDVKGQTNWGYKLTYHQIAMRVERWFPTL